MTKTHPRGNTLPVLLIILAVVIGGAIVALLLVFKEKPADTTTNTVVNTNAAMNTNTTANANMAVNTNASANANFSDYQSSNSNTSTSPTADWKTYTSEEFGYSLKYPKTWTVKESNARNEVTDTMCRFITITNPETKHSLHVGIRESGQITPDIWCRTGIGAGDFTAGETVTIAGSSIETTKLVYLNYAVEIFFSPSSHPTTPVVIGTHELSSFFYDAYDENQNLNSGDEYTTVKTILESITFTN